MRGIPNEEYWGEPGDPIAAWAKPIIARGPRQDFEMEQVLPGKDPEDPDSDPITESNELKDAGHRHEARKLLMKLCEGDLRCLDAHAHLGNLVFDRSPDEAIRHYEVGVRIGELSLGRSSRESSHGVMWTTGPSCGVCAVTGCAAGALVDSTKRSVRSTVCCGSIRPTIKARDSWLARSVRE